MKKREGDFAGRPDNGHDHDRNSIPKIEGMKQKNRETKSYPLKPLCFLYVLIYAPNNFFIFSNLTNALFLCSIWRGCEK